MKNNLKLLGFAVLTAAVVFGVIACDDSIAGIDPDLPGTITISPNTNTFINMELTATYSGSETVTFQWKKSVSNVGTASTNKPNKYTPNEPGIYSVTVSAPGYSSKTSKSVNVIYPPLTGTLSVSPNVPPIAVNTPLTATYVGDKEVTFLWRLNGENVGTPSTDNPNTYEPIDGGWCTVSVTVEGYSPITSEAIWIQAKTLTGTVFCIDPPSAEVGDELTAIYGGPEFIHTYQWQWNGVNVGTNNDKYTPIVAGDYTVTVKATGYESKTSPPVTVTAPDYNGNIGGLYDWLLSQYPNSVFNPYTIKLNISYADLGDLYTALYNVPDRYVKIELFGNTIYSIPGYAFQNCTSLVSITIPDSVITIGWSAFGNCSNLSSVIIGSDVETIEVYAFYGCSNLVSITIPDSVTDIGMSAFEDCASLSSVTIGSSVTSIGDSAFKNCTSLTSVTIGNSVETIGGNAFESCTSLSNITIPDSVTSIGAYAFDGCTSLFSVTFDGIINSSDFSEYAFLGNLWDVFYDTDPTDGTPGTYTTLYPVTESSTWTLEP
jgi:hypothetical protein